MRHFRGHAEHLTKAAVDVRGAFAEVHFVEGEAGQLRSRCQERLRLLQPIEDRPPFQRTGEQFAKRPEARDKGLRPRDLTG